MTGSRFCASALALPKTLRSNPGQVPPGSHLDVLPHIAFIAPVDQICGLDALSQSSRGLRGQLSGMLNVQKETYQQRAFPVSSLAIIPSDSREQLQLMQEKGFQNEGYYACQDKAHHPFEKIDFGGEL